MISLAGHKNPVRQLMVVSNVDPVLVGMVIVVVSMMPLMRSRVESIAVESQTVESNATLEERRGQSRVQ